MRRATRTAATLPFDGKWNPASAGRERAQTSSADALTPPKPRAAEARKFVAGERAARMQRDLSLPIARSQRPAVAAISPSARKTKTHLHLKQG